MQRLGGRETCATLTVLGEMTLRFFDWVFNLRIIWDCRRKFSARRQDRSPPPLQSQAINPKPLRLGALRCQGAFAVAGFVSLVLLPSVWVDNASGSPSILWVKL